MAKAAPKKFKFGNLEFEEDPVRARIREIFNS